MTFVTSRARDSALLIGLAFVGACSSCSGDALATVVALEGNADYSRAASPAWEVAAIDLDLSMGDAIRTRDRSTAKLELDDGTMIDVEPNTTLRFRSDRPEDREPTIELLEGAAVLSADGDATIDTMGGRAHFGQGSRVRLTQTDDGLELTVTVGRARLEADDGTSTEVGTGETVVVAHGGRTAHARRPPPAAAAAPAPAPPPIEGGIRAVLRGSRHEVRAETDEAWRAVDNGSHALSRGTRVRQGQGGVLELEDGGRSVTLRGGGEFVVGEGESLARIVSGTPEIESTADGVAIATTGGVLVTRPAGAGRAGAGLEARGDGSIGLRVDVGAIEIRRGEESEIITAGETADLVLAEASATAAVAPDPSDQALDHADFVVGGGGSFVVRDARAPTAIGIALGDACPGGASLERLVGNGGHRIAAYGRGSGTINLAFPPGNHRYEVRCLTNGEPRGRAVKSGRIRVMQSSGQAPLPRSAPESTVDADGRTYTVHYQNHLPVISARWPNAPPGATVLVVQSAGGVARRVNVRGATHRFAPGELGEGAHRFHFESPATRRQSRETRLSIRFDSSAASASLSGPADGSFGPGESVNVTGTALRGWEVSVGGQDVPVGRDQRFSRQVTVPPSGVVTVRLSRPGQGVHYYLRRARGASSP